MIKNKFPELLGIKRIDRRDIIKLTSLDSHMVLKLYKNETKGIDFTTLYKLCFALDCTSNDILRYIPDNLSDKHLYE